MPVATEASHAELNWTGVETSFAPGFSALDASYLVVTYLSAASVLSTLTRGVHYNVALAGDGAVTISPIVFPAAPGLLIIDRSTPATQGVDFVNLNMYDPAVHTGIADRLTMIVAELKDKVRRFLLPFTNLAGVIDFRPYRIKAADPIDDADLATRSWVLVTTGIINLQNYVIQCAASAAAAAASAASALGYQTGAQAARDQAAAWSDTAENTNVPGTSRFSAFHWSQKSAASAATVLAALAVTDYGFVLDAPTETRDYGTVP